MNGLDKAIQLGFIKLIGETFHMSDEFEREAIESVQKGSFEEFLSKHELISRHYDWKSYQYRHRNAMKRKLFGYFQKSDRGVIDISGLSKRLVEV